MSKILANFSLLLIASSILTGCAAGAATAGYSIKSQTADNLSVDGERRLIDRAKKEIMAEIYQRELQN